MPAAFDEMKGTGEDLRPAYVQLAQWLEQVPKDFLQHRLREAELLFRRTGITFSVYGETDANERLIPFDVVPRILAASEWTTLSRGLEQRIKALNAYIKDVYGKREVLKAGIVPEDLVFQNPVFRPEMNGQRVPHDIYVFVAGIDVVRVDADTFYVLEDNARTPSGVSYMLQNREVMMRLFPDLFARHRVAPVENYPDELLATLKSVAPVTAAAEPTVVLLTPGMYNSAYFEHSFLAQQLGIQLVEGRDLAVQDNVVYMRTTRGLRRVDVIYRRIDDDFLDPQAFRADSLLGVPGIMEAYRAGNVALANAPGNGVADDKVVYAYVPEMIRYYLQQDAILPNVPTYLCWRDSDRQHVLQNLDKLVVKAANEAGGYGMLIGPHSTVQQREQFAAKIEANPRNYIAQPTLALSRVPTLIDDHLEGRHVDLRPYILYGKDIHVMAGGLTRVALRKGSLVVNSSQGGGSKDTWVLEAGGHA